ncbi:hypothetical protein LWI29_033879 [Acer saccharum]|uniref:RING-type E3 ubiquitin transferase n=1 Tax=Acer saccharum TaxID=4024 RepID=A0AA39RFV3_ACESA|nr:hypothetical protein LWI29_033879 [Acer saccharum]
MPSSAVDHHHHHHHRDAPPAAPPKPDTTKLVSLLLKAIIMTLITTLFFLLIGLASLFFLPLLLTSLHRHHSRNRNRLRRNKPDLSTVFSPKDIKKLPQFRFSLRPEPETEAQPECVVCLEGFRQGQWCRRLVGCGHVFHRKCVDTWLVKVAACPTCRTPVRLSSDEHQ